jgi:membrane-associated phospholipid phosphatase
MQSIATITAASPPPAEISCRRLRISAASRLAHPITRFDLLMAAALVSLSFTEAILCRATALTVPAFGSMFPWTDCKIATAFAAFCVLYPNARLAEATRLFFWSSLWGSPLLVLVQLTARSPFPLVDRQLAAIDRVLHISTAAIHHPFIAQPWMTFSILIYVLFIPLLFAPVLLPCFCGFPQASRRFVVGVIIAVVVGTVLFAFFPAVGPWASEAMSPGNLQLDMGNYLVRLKSGIPMQMDLGLSALVSFPSEHVAVAILAARALSAIQPLRKWIWPLSILVCCSTITTGWHYGIDVVGGIAVATFSAWLANAICGWLETNTPEKTLEPAIELA